MNGKDEFHIKCKTGDVGRYVLLPGDPDRVEKIAKYLDNAVKVQQKREYTVYTGYLDGEKVSVCSTGIGGPSAAIALEELANIGGDTFIRVGTAGGMDINIKGGDLVIASGAIRNEGTSKEYLPLEFPAVANHEVMSALITAAENLGREYHIGVVHCKDSFYVKHKWEAYLAGGALCSEMESAALFTVGSYRKVRVGTILLAVANQEREKLGLENVFADDTELAIKTAVEAVRVLIKK